MTTRFQVCHANTEPESHQTAVVCIDGHLVRWISDLHHWQETLF